MPHQTISTYCAPVWSATTDKNVSMVEVAQRSAITALSDYPTGKSTSQLFTDWGIDKVRQLWARLDAQWLFRLRKREKYHTFSDCMADLVPRRETMREYRLGSK
ncbi:hypothetical protein RvY_11225 [Ramazzottius varieornatus]|uniref:Uncharacterized protein n=1 Tax=Ramazzottius varieornatus TaxID=947166 RepID=A0A1D1VJT0_RAMVA|nr:hypothetical protein RvY_11225 [Ramazzottius varieornatus]